MNEDIKQLGKYLGKKIDDGFEELKDFIEESLAPESEEFEETEEESSPFDEEDESSPETFDIEPEYEGKRKVKNEPEEEKKAKKKGFFGVKKKEKKEKEQED